MDAMVAWHPCVACDCVECERCARARPRSLVLRLRAFRFSSLTRRASPPPPPPPSLPRSYHAASVFLLTKRDQYCALVSYMLEDVGHRTMKRHEKTFWSALRQSAMNSLQLLDAATETSSECTIDISQVLLSNTTLAENILQTLEYEEYCLQAIRLLRHCLERGGLAALKVVASLESVVDVFFYLPLHLTRIMLTISLAPPNIFDDITWQVRRRRDRALAKQQLRDRAGHLPRRVPPVRQADVQRRVRESRAPLSHRARRRARALLRGGAQPLRVRIWNR